ncbi:unnamed protein product [Effrenium voratum]|nr:unnamed protein product [Effrenium voratum]CAJ1413052.1 unnamed protein product [Effrenium voratum]
MDCCQARSLCGKSRQMSLIVDLTSLRLPVLFLERCQAELSSLPQLGLDTGGLDPAPPEVHLRQPRAWPVEHPGPKKAICAGPFDPVEPLPDRLQMLTLEAWMSGLPLPRDRTRS